MNDTMLERLAGWMLPCLALVAMAGSARPEENMKIIIRTTDAVVTGKLDDNAAARGFAELLPLTLDLEDYASTEKVADLPQKLTLEGTPPGFEPRPGDITHYAPWGNIAIFHKGFRYSSGLVKLGEIDTGLDVLRRPGKLRVTIEKVSN